MTSPDAIAPPEAAGLRLLRVLGRGSRSTVWLGFDDAVEGDAAVAVKLLPGHVDPLEVGRELEALHRGRGRHVARLLDVDATAEQVALVFERLPREDLASLLARRQRFAAGEAVTLLAPLAATVQMLHDAGVAHGALAPSAVVFDASGAPVLTGFGGAALFEAGAPEAARETIDAVAADRRAVRALADTVLARVVGERARAARQLLAVVEAAPAGDMLGCLAQRVFEVAAAVPIDFGDDPPSDALEGREARVVPLGEPVAPPASPPRDPLRHDGPLARLLERGALGDVRSALSRRWRSWTSTRRRAVVAIAAGAVAIALAVAIVPPPADDASPPAEGAGPAQPETAPSEIETSAGASPTQADADQRQLASDDPLDALPVLLARRATCFDQLSVLCLDGVVQPGSAAEQVDRAAIAAVLADGAGDVARDIDAGSPLVVERLGDTALVALEAGASAPHSGPASLLLMKGEAGWRIRDYLAATG